jgi:hypothetical protein
MLTGKQPYQADTPMGIAVKHITEPVPHILEVNPTLPPWMEKVISTAMAKDKNDRFATAVEMIETIKALIQDNTYPAGNLNNKTILKASSSDKTVVTKKKNRFNPLVAIALFLLCAVTVMVGSGAFLFSRNSLPFGMEAPSETPTTTSVPNTATSAPVIVATELPSTPTDTATVTPLAPTDTPIPSLPVIGGADKIAFLRNNDIWIMNVDGSDLKSVTNDGSAKFNLEWLPGSNTLLYITGKTIKTVDINTLQEETITNFLSSEYFESFHVSPDGKQVAISVGRELHVVPFDLAILKSVTKKSALLAMKGCLFYKKFGVLDALWSDDGQKITIKYLAPSGNVAVETLRILDIHLCNEAEPARVDEFPLGRFPFSGTLVNFDWDGDQLFLMNSNVRNGGFGDLGFYNSSIHKGEKLAPVDGNCCYRDATFSPDGTFVLFAFQDIRLTDSPIVLYYVPIDALTTGGTLQPMKLPDNFFTKRTDAPMPAFRRAQNN